MRRTILRTPSATAPHAMNAPLAIRGPNVSKYPAVSDMAYSERHADVVIRQLQRKNNAKNRYHVFEGPLDWLTEI